MKTWFPPQSPVRIEYARDLLRLLRPRNDGEYATGVLYGTRATGVVSVRSERPRTGLEPVGIFAARWRGEVFLTEEDLIRLEALESPAAIGLVIAGSSGGFFVPERDGSMQTIQSYQEFPIRPPEIATSKSWLLRALAAGASIIVAMTILAWPSSAFTIQADEGQMRIVLHRTQTPGARLEIIDGSEHHSISVSPDLTSVVYAPRTSDVHVRLVR